MVEVVEVVQNDEGYDINFTIKNYSGNAVDLASVSEIKFKVAAVGESSLELDGNCTITDASNGECKYTVQDGELATIGFYHAELQITYSGGKIITTKRFDVRVVKDLP